LLQAATAIIRTNRIKILLKYFIGVIYHKGIGNGEWGIGNGVAAMLT